MQGPSLGMRVHHSQSWAWTSYLPWNSAHSFWHTEAMWSTAQGMAGQSQIWVSATMFLCVLRMDMNHRLENIPQRPGTHKSKKSVFIFPEKTKTHFKSPAKVFDLCVYTLLELKTWTIGDLLSHSFQILLSSLEFLKNVLSLSIWAPGLRELSFYLSSSNYNFEIKVFLSCEPERFILSGTMGLRLWTCIPTLKELSFAFHIFPLRCGQHYNYSESTQPLNTSQIYSLISNYESRFSKKILHLYQFELVQKLYHF